MFENPGQKLKKLSKVVFWLVVVLNMLLLLSAALSLLANGMKLSFLGLIGLLLGLALSVVFAWLLSIGLYAFGELVEDTHASRRALERVEGKLTKEHTEG